MKWLAVVPLLLMSGVNVAPAKSKPRNWTPGEVTNILGPRKTRQPGWGTIGPEIVSTERRIMLESTSYGTRWAIEIALPDADYVVTLSPPPRSSSLMKLGAGSRVDCAVEGKSVYLEDDEGKVFRTAIAKRSNPR